MVDRSVGASSLLTKKDKNTLVWVVTVAGNYPEPQN